MDAVKGMNKIAVILAAGVGRRLRPFTKNIPKVLLDIHGKRIIERISDQLEILNVDTGILVIGHMKEKVKNFVRKIESSVEWIFVENPNYLSTNTGFSALLGIEKSVEFSPSEVIIWNGDVVTEFDNLLLLDKEKSTALLVDFEKELTEESYKVILLEDGSILLGKELPIDKSAGEYVGISKIIKRDLEKFIEILRTRVAANRNCYYDDTFAELSKISRVSLVPAVKFASEIDFLEDYLRVLEKISE